VKDKYVVAGVLVSAGASGALYAVENKIKKEMAEAGIVDYVFAWHAVLPWAVGILAYTAGHAAKNDSAKSFGAGALLFGAASLVDYASALLTYSLAGGGK
jgi:hypothetical protein